MITHTLLFSQEGITIGNAVWQKSNLTAKTFMNGTPIFQAKNEKDWENAKTKKEPAWCYYMYDQSNEEKYGILYNWYAVNDPRGLAPEGWHIPKIEEWDAMLTFLGGGLVAGNKLRSSKDWKNLNGLSDNAIGFSAKPAGFVSSGGHFFYAGVGAYWWCADKNNSKTAFYYQLNQESDYVSKSDYTIEVGFSVRCVKNN